MFDWNDLRYFLAIARHGSTITAGKVLGTSQPTVADSIWAVYASRAYIERHGKPERAEDLSHHLLVSLDESMATHRAVKWLKAAAPDAKIAARNNSVLGLVYAVKSGVGLGPLPTAIADEQEDLVRVLG